MRPKRKSASDLVETIVVVGRATRSRGGSGRRERRAKGTREEWKRRGQNGEGRGKEGARLERKSEG